MIALALSLLGRISAATPEPLLEALSVVCGEVILWAAPRRRRVLRSNLHHAFPDRPRSWRRNIARESSRRLVETALLSLAAPYLSEERIRRIGTLAPSVKALAASLAQKPHPLVFGTLHLALWETQVWFKFLSEIPLPELGVIFRPIDNPALDGFVKRTRERHGAKLLSRREGFASAQAMLRTNGMVGVLFDQNAGDRGALTLFFGRVCSSTELPGVLASKFGAELRTFHPRRTAFWRVTFESDPIDWDGTPGGATLALNRWLEKALSEEAYCASWLWAHDRWRNQDVPRRRLRLEARRNLLDEELRVRGLAQLPRKTRFWVRMPNWLGDTVIALPLLHALRRSRPDAEVTLLARPQQAALLARLGVADAVIALPSRGLGYFAHFAAMRARYPDTWLLLTNSVRGDLEAWIAGCPQRFGIKRPGVRRPLLSHAYRVPADFDEAGRHQLLLLQDFLVHFGLNAAPDTAPFGQFGAAPRVGPVGLIPGSENDPSKRWPVRHWRALIEIMPAERFVVFGTPGDREIATEVCKGFDAHRVENLAGRTDILAFAERLASCRLLVTNDTGGMHLANALGVPLIALFGPTNPIRTGPVFRAPFVVLQPPGCPPHGAAPLDGLEPAAVLSAVAGLQSGPR